MFSVITDIHNKKTIGLTLMELFTATEKLKSFLTTRDVRCVHHGRVNIMFIMFTVIINITSKPKDLP
jgi:hypothetical protein